MLTTLFHRTQDWTDIEAMLEAGTVDSADALRWVGEILGEVRPSCRHLGPVVARVADDGGHRGADPDVWRSPPASH